MNRIRLDEVSKRVFWEILEQNLFLLPDPLAHELPSEMPEPMLEVRMRYRGTVNGRCILLLPKSICTELVATLECQDEPATEEDLQDAGREALNLLTPHILREWLEGGGHYEVEVPESSWMSPADWKEAAHRTDYVGVEVNGLPVLLRVEWDGRVA